MSDKKVKTRIQNKHDLECNWIKATGFCPMEGELIIYDIEVDGSDNVLTGALEGTGRTEPYKHVRYKIGDGIHYVNDLPFVSEGASKRTTSTGRYSHAEGAETIAQGNQAHAEGNKTEATGHQAHAEGYETKATAVAAHAEGLGTLAANDGAHAQGKFTKAIGDASAANGYWTIAEGTHQFVIGRVNANDENNLFEVGGGAVYYDGTTDTFTEDEFDRFNVFEVSSEGYAGAERIATKDTIFNRKEGAVKDGVEYARWHNGPTGKVDPIIIPGAVASGFQSVAFGGQRIDKTLKAYKNNPEIPAEEPQTQALGDQSFATGGSVIVNGDWSAGFGKETTTYQKAAFAAGGGTRAGCTEEEYTNYAAVQRDDTSTYAASYSLSMAEGELTKALGRTSHAEGRYGLTTGMASHVEGNESVAVGKYSHAEGWQTKTGTFTGNNKTGEIVIQTSGTAAHTEGRGTTADADYAHAEGINTVASNIASHAEGNGSIASGQYSHAEGSSQASKEYAHAEGKGTTASGIASHTEGEGTIATHANAHAEGYSTDAINENAHAEGSNSEASGAASHAEGSLTKAKGLQTHAEGASTIAVGNNSHTEGYRTLAKGVAAHAEGYSVTDLTNKYDANSSDGTIKTDWEANKNFGAAVGQGSHAEGLNNLAYGRYSHVGGSYSEAVGNNSFAHGDHVTASVANQVAFGKYNAQDSNALFIVGNGTSDSDRKNAFTVKTDGTAECVDLKVTGEVSNGTNTFYFPETSGTLALTNDIPSTTGELTNDSGFITIDHSHNNLYYTESEIDDKLSGKSNTGHTHTKAQITDFAHNHDDRYYTETEVNDRIAIIAGLGDNSIQKKSGVNLASDNVLLTIANIDITTTPTALGEGATALGSSYQITCTSDTLSLKPRIKLTAKNGYNFTFSLNATAATLVKTLTNQYKAQAENGAPSFYLKFGTNYLLITDYTNLKLNEVLGATTGGSVTLIAPSTVSQTIVDNIAVNAYVDKVISCIAGGKESFVANSGMAPGERAFAVNTMTQAIGQASAAFGGCSVAGATYSAAFANSIVWGPSSLGSGNCYIGTNASTSIGNGHGCSTDGPQSAIFGFKNTIGSNGNQATVIGALNNSDYKRTFIGGHGNTAKADDQVILGAFAEASANDYFVIGCGDGDAYRKNAFKVTNDGVYGIGTTYYGSSGKTVNCTKLATESWVTNEALGVIGYKNTTAGTVGSVMLYNYTNDGSDGFQIAAASGVNAVSLGKGTRATADMAFAANNQTTASHGASAAFGYKTSTTNNVQLVCGSGTGGSTTDAYFRVACGSKDFAVLTNCSIKLGNTILTEVQLQKLLAFVDTAAIDDIFNI